MKKTFFQKNKTNKNAGFTLMETLAAIFILLLAITGPMVFVQNGLRTAFLSRDQVTAFFLAQDAIEYVKNYRDSLWINRQVTQANLEDWLGNEDNGPLADCFSSGCSIDTTEDIQDSVLSCQSDNNPGCNREQLEQYTPLNYHTEKTTFTNSDGQKSIFSREIKITPVDGSRDQEAEVKVTIRWKSHEGIGTREIVVRENIFNWANAFFGSVELTQ